MKRRALQWGRIGGKVWVMFVGVGLALRAEDGCLACHEEAGLTLEREGREVSLFVPAGGFAGSAHEGFACLDCHFGLDEASIPHAEPMPEADRGCLECHDGLAESHGFHGDFARQLSDTPMSAAVRCSGCHDPHATVGSEEAFGFGRAEQAMRCGGCHTAVSLEFIHSAHAMALEHAEEGAPGCLDCHQSPEMADLWRADPSQRKIREAELCLSCHLENPEVARKNLYGTPFMVSFKESVHGKALFGGNASAPGCVDCHGEHEVARRAAGDSLVSRASIAQQCARCHAAESHDYLELVHARVFARGNLDAPVCTDCHGEHHILGPTDPEASIAPVNMAEQVCGDCHGSVKFTKRYGLEPDRVSTFEESFHGLAVRGGAVEVVNCASCHGYHAVRSSDDPASMTHVENIARTCGQCHEGANERFAQGKMHVSIRTDSREPILYWIATVYTWGIYLIIGGMVVHNGMDFLKKVRLKAGSHWKEGRKEEPSQTGEVPHRLYVRMTLNERIQHGTLALSFMILVVSGFMLRYPEAWWVVLLRELSSQAFEWRGIAHRVAAVVMVMAGLWHIGYLGFTARGRALFSDLLPRWKDVSDMKGIFRYNLGFQQEKPPFARFSYMEKAEYWALIWGSLVMTVTGILLWYETLTIGMFTKLGFDVSRTVHVYEAILATLAIVVWHFYWVIFNPDVYPMNLSWLTGRLSEEEMATEHPLELERIKEVEAAAKGDAGHDIC